MKGFVLAEEGHVVQALAPVDISGGKTGQAFSMKKYQHASIIVPVGVSAAAFTKILVNECDDKDGTEPSGNRLQCLQVGNGRRRRAGSAHGGGRGRPDAFSQ